MSGRAGPSSMKADDPRFGEFVNLTLDELGNCDIVDSDDETIDPTFVIENEHSSDSEVDQSDNDEQEIEVENERQRGNSSFRGRNDFLWNKTPPPRNVRTRAHNIIVQLPGLKQAAVALGNKPNPQDVWGLLFTSEMIDIIVTWTNVKIQTVREKYRDQTLSFIHTTNAIEMKGFLGLLIFTQIFKSGGESVESLFATDGTGRDLFRCTMTMKRFLFLLACLRFDDAATREVRKQTDPVAAISQIFDMLIDNSQKMYSLGSSVCVDEMLVAFRERCKFKVYMPKKPVKYGIKIMCLADARNSYLYNAYIYSGRGSDGISLPEEEKKKKEEENVNV